MAKSQAATYDEVTKTAAFVIVFRQVIWLENEAKRRGISKSELMREILDAAMSHQEKAA